jgi:hypothetical protein
MFCYILNPQLPEFYVVHSYDKVWIKEQEKHWTKQIRLRLVPISRVTYKSPDL